jgi:hypothetical protein
VTIHSFYRHEFADLASQFGNLRVLLKELYQLLMLRSGQALAGWSILQLLPCQWASLVLLGLATSWEGARISQTNLAHSLIRYLGLEEESCGLHMSLLGHAFPRTYIHDSLTPFNLGCLENPSGPPSVICFRHVMSNWGHAFQGLVPFNLGCFTLKSTQARMSLASTHQCTSWPFCP